MNNKVIGTVFERLMVDFFKERDWWVHFISPNAAGAQPFDIIAARKGQTIVGDCKTSVSKTFNVRRLEDNQVLAFDKWLACGNSMPKIFVLHDNQIHIIDYQYLKERKSINLDVDQNIIKIKMERDNDEVYSGK